MDKFKKAVFPLTVTIAYLLFIFYSGFLKTKPVLIPWISISGIIIFTGLYRYLSYIKKGFPFSGWKSLELLLPLLLLIETLIRFFNKPLLHLAYISVIVIISGYFPFKIIISCIAAIFLLGIPSQWWNKGYFSEESGSYFFILVTGIISYYISHKRLKISKKAVEDLEKLKNSALNLDASTEGSLFNEDRFSHLVKSVLDTERDLKEMLFLIKKIINTDAVALFMLEGDSLVLKASTEDKYSKSAYHGEGYLLSVIKGKKSLIQPRFKYSLFDIENTASKDAGSSLCVPVFDGSVSVGVLEMVSNGESAFGAHEEDIAASFAGQIGQTIGKARSYVEVERFAKGFKSLHEASRSFGTSLRVEEIAEKLVELVFGMVNSSAVGFFIPDKGELKVVAKEGFEPEDESFYSKGTYFDLIVKNKQPLHFSHLEGKRGVYPFRIPDAKTFLGIPIMSSGNDVLGILAVISREADAISSFHGHFLSIMADQAALSMTNARLHHEVEKLAMTDGLTRLYNHKHFYERLGEEFQRYERFPQPISLLVMDIDYFKKINDVHGHPAGDAVLLGLAAILKKTLRGIDIIARYGGEEFAAVLLNTETPRAKKIAERLRVKVMNTPFAVDGNDLTIALSIGVATYPHDAENKEDLINKADRALYYAKDNGRNQVCLWKDIGK
ncbi:MAG: diguanylate cyclase [Nitrospirae bacterium]|nr:diguanylate cyclase [Nitrospirota bacterium]